MEALGGSGRLWEALGGAALLGQGFLWGVFGVAKPGRTPH